MMSHFLRNDLQKIVSGLEYLSLDDLLANNKTQIKYDEIINIATRSSKTIEKVTLIFEVLQSGSISDETEEPEKLGLSEYLEEIIGEFVTDNVKIELQIESCYLPKYKYLAVAIRELILFLIDSNGRKNSQEFSIRIATSFKNQNLVIQISDKTSTPIPSVISKRLTAKITERWESHGFYIGITLASVIMQYFKGKLTISPQPNHGNIFQLILPKTLIKFS